MNHARGAAALRLERALRLAEGGRAEEARKEALAAVAPVGTDRVALVVGSRILAGTGDLLGAARLIDRAAAQPGASPLALSTKLELWSRIGRTAEAIEAGMEAIRAAPRRAGVLLFLSRIFDQHAAWEQALALLDEAIAESEPSARLELAAAELLDKLDREAEARARFARAAELSPADLPHALALCDVGARAGELEQAERWADRAVAIDPTSVGARIALAELLLWKLDLAGARASAEAALAIDASSAAGHRILGGVAVLEGRLEDAEGHLRRALELDPSDAEALVFQAEARLRGGALYEAVDLVDRAILLAHGVALSPRMLRLLSTLRHGDHPEIFGANGAGEVRGALVALFPEAAPLLVVPRSEDLERLLSAALERLGGNRTVTQTVIAEGGRLERFRARRGPRATARRALELVRVLPEPELMRLFDEVIAEHPGSTLPLCHRGELYLWLGHYDEARADLERVIATFPFTRWAHIGLTALEMVLGRYPEALAACARGVEVMRSTGTSVYGHRGEVLRRMGALREARGDLEEAARLHPSRVSVELNLALLDGAGGNFSGQAARFAALFPRAFGLFDDAAVELGIEPIYDARSAPPEEVRAILEQSLAMMKGNRSSSCATYLTREGRVRVIPRAPPKENREDELKRARRLLYGKRPAS